jgi:DNA gyrase subunit B
MTAGNEAPDIPAQGAVYDATSIEVLDGLEVVRRRPGMFIGDTRDGSGLHHLVEELVDNVLAEHLAGRCHHLVLTLHAGGALSVEDDGPGIPVEPVGRPGDARTWLELVLTTLGQGRRSRNGLYGVGLACVNALCEDLVVEVRRGGHLYRQQYRRGRPLSPLARLAPARGSGTRVTIHPDPLIFTPSAFDIRRVTEMLRPLAFLDPALRIEVVDERAGGRREVLFARSIADWVALLSEGQDGFPVEPLRVWGAGDDLTVELALRWTTWPWTRARTFVNHREVRSAAPLRGLALGLKRAARQAGLAVAPSAWEPGALRRGLAAVFDIRSPSVEITGCCRDELTAHAALTVRRVVGKCVAEELEHHRALVRTLWARSSGAPSQPPAQGATTS